MYITIARYAGAAGKMAEAAPKVQQGLVPVLKDQKGFHGYTTFATEQGDIVALGIWESAEALANSREKVRSFVTDNLAAIGIGDPTERFNGTIGPHAIVAPQSGGPGQSLYCMVRKSENIPGPDTMVPVVKEMVAATQKAPGFRGAYVSRSAGDQTRGASVLFFDNREHAQAAHEAALAIMHKHLPNVTVRVAASGQTAVLAMA